MDKSEYIKRAEVFEKLFHRFAGRLSSESEENVAHYLAVAELEMAYESFLLSIIDEGIPIDKETGYSLKKMGEDLGVDKESIFKKDFWSYAEALWPKTS